MTKQSFTLFTPSGQFYVLNKNNFLLSMVNILVRTCFINYGKQYCHFSVVACSWNDMNYTSYCIFILTSCLEDENLLTKITQSAIKSSCGL